MRRRNHRVVVYFNDAEIQMLNEKVAKSKLSREAFLRCCVASKEVKEAPPADVPELIMALRKSQLLLEKAIQSVDTNPEELQDVLRETREAEQLVARTYNMRN